MYPVLNLLPIDSEMANVHERFTSQCALPRSLPRFTGRVKATKGATLNIADFLLFLRLCPLVTHFDRAIEKCGDLLVACSWLSG
jgi:hypothetical protein